AFHTHRPIAAAPARPLSPPSARRKFSLPAICPIPASELTGATAPRPSNHPRKQNADRRRACVHYVYRLRLAKNAATPLAGVTGTFLFFDQQTEGDDS